MLNYGSNSILNVIMGGQHRHIGKAQIMMQWAELGLMRPTYRQQIGRKDRGVWAAGIGRIGGLGIGRGRNGITPWGRVYHCNLTDQHIYETAQMQNINHMVLPPNQS